MDLRGDSLSKGVVGEGQLKERFSSRDFSLKQILKIILCSDQLISSH